MKIHPFIFNWKGQYEKTLLTELQLLEIFDNVTVINSYEDYKKDSWVNLDKDAYFAEQFVTACKMFDGDVMMHVQGDATYHDWKSVVDSARHYYAKYKYGIYAPNVNFTSYTSRIVDIDNKDLEEDINLRNVSTTDCTAWFISKDILKKFELNWEEYLKTKFGWGICSILGAYCKLEGKKIIRDYSYTVNHPQNTNYSKNDAGEAAKDFLNTLDQKIIDNIPPKWGKKNKPKATSSASCANSTPASPNNATLRSAPTLTSSLTPASS